MTAKITLAVLTLVVLSQPGQAFAECGDLSKLDFSSLRHAPTEVFSVQPVSTPNGRVCEIQGVIRPDVGYIDYKHGPAGLIEKQDVPDGTPGLGNVNFILRLPESVSGWNGRFIELGCGGTCVDIQSWAERCPVERGYACIVSDMGNPGKGDAENHQSPSGTADGRFAVDNLRARINFGYRAAHVAALAGKAITNAYYKRDPLGKPMPSVFMGCSTGGYQGLVEAQRFPWDFNGIVAIAPDMDEADLAMRKVWFFHNWHQLDGHDAHLLHSQVHAACETYGEGDNWFAIHPIECAREFNPAVLECKHGPKSDCLMPGKVAAATKAYQGPPTSNGKPTSGIFPGSEFSLDQIPLGPNKGPQNYWNNWAIDFFKGMFRLGGAGKWTDDQPDWSIDCDPSDKDKKACFDWDRDYKELGLTAYYNNTNPDLRKFEQVNGRLILVQGGSDASEFPGAVVDYYQMVVRTMGGLDKTRRFARLFVVPGMNHCTGGPGPFGIDYLTALETWIKRTPQGKPQGTPPKKLTGRHFWKDENEIPWGELVPLVFGYRYPGHAYQCAFEMDTYAYPREPSPVRKECSAPVLNTR